MALAYASTLWANQPYEAFSQAIAVTILIAFVKAHVRVSGVRRSARDIFISFLTIAVISIFLVVAVPSYGLGVGEHDGKWQGAFNHKNALGNFCAFSAIFTLWYCLRFKTVLSFVSLLLLSLLLAFSQSYTSYGVFVVGVLMVLGVRFSSYIRRLKSVFVVVVILFSVSVVIFTLFGDELDFLGKSTTFSGRNEIWVNILLKTLQSPIYGFGFSQLYADVSSKVSDFELDSGFVVGTAHNGLIELSYSLGVIGVLVFFYYLLDIVKRAQGASLGLVLPIVIGFVVLNTFESRLLGWNFYFLILLYVEALRDGGIANEPSRLGKRVF